MRYNLNDRVDLSVNQSHRAKRLNQNVVFDIYIDVGDAEGAYCRAKYFEIITENKIKLFLLLFNVQTTK